MSATRDTSTKSSSRTPSPARQSTAEANSTRAQDPVARGGKLTCPPSRLADISARPYTALNAPTAVESRVQEALRERPCSAMDSFKPATSPSASALSGPLAPPVYFARPTSATSSILGRFFDSGRESPRDDSSSSAGPADVTARRSSHLDRPTSADMLLPPRRELPFQRSSLSSSPESDMSRPLIRLSTERMGPPPLPSRIADLRSSSRHGWDQESNLPPLPQPTLVPESTHRSPSTPTYTSAINTQSGHDCADNRFQNRAATISPASSPSSLNMSSTSALPTPRPSSSGHFHQPLNLPRISDQEPMSASNDPRLKNSNYPPLNGSYPSDDLTEYAKLPGDSRRASLNEYIYHQLQSDSFLLLVEDMETCWARITSGVA